jgi:hypothetical protein
MKRHKIGDESPRPKEEDGAWIFSGFSAVVLALTGFLWLPSSRLTESME